MTWTTFEHPADVGLVVDAPSGAELFADAARAYFSLVCDPARIVVRERYELDGAAETVEELLVGWLNDLVFLVEGRGIVCSEVRFDAWSPTSYRAVLGGEPADPERHALRSAVKAATYHGLRIEQDGAGWHARVILDV